MHPNSLEQLSKHMAEVNFSEHQLANNKSNGTLVGKKEQKMAVSAAESNVEAPKRRHPRELGNRGYVKKMRNVPFLGIFCAILYAFFMSSSVALLRVVSIHPITVLVYRSVIQGSVFFLVTLYNRKSLLGIPGERWPVAGRAVFGMLNQLTWYTSIKYISLTDSSAIYYSAPVYVTVLAFIMLGEPFGLVELTSVLVTLVGVTLISKPGFLPFFSQEAVTSSINNTLTTSAMGSNLWTSPMPSNYSSTPLPLIVSSVTYLTNGSSVYPAYSHDHLTSSADGLISVATSNNTFGTTAVAGSVSAPIGSTAHMIGMSLAFGGALTFALTNICLRKMRRTPTEVTATWFSIFTILSCAPIAYYMQVLRLPQNPLEWTVVMLVGIFSTLGQVAFTLALKIEKAGPVSVAQTLNIVIVLFYQIAFFHESISGTSLIGVVLIILSVLLIGLKDTLFEQRLMVRAIKRIRKQGQFDLHHHQNSGLKDSSLQKVQVCNGQSTLTNPTVMNGNKPPLCTCYTIQTKRNEEQDTQKASLNNNNNNNTLQFPPSPPPSSLDTNDQLLTSTKLQRQL